jgi:transposase InsO family protein
MPNPLAFRERAVRLFAEHRPERASACSTSDTARRFEIARVRARNRQCYGARTIWYALRREGFDVA